MRLQNIHAPLRNFSPNFDDVFVQVIILGHFGAAANQSIIKLVFTLCIFCGIYWLKYEPQKKRFAPKNCCDILVDSRLRFSTNILHLA